jgi:hypothetical protein
MTTTITLFRLAGGPARDVVVRELAVRFLASAYARTEGPPMAQAPRLAELVGWFLADVMDSFPAHDEDGFEVLFEMLKAARPERSDWTQAPERLLSEAVKHVVDTARGVCRFNAQVRNRLVATPPLPADILDQMRLVLSAEVRDRSHERHTAEDKQTAGWVAKLDAYLAGQADGPVEAGPAALQAGGPVPAGSVREQQPGAAGGGAGEPGQRPVPPVDRPAGRRVRAGRPLRRSGADPRRRAAEPEPAGPDLSPPGGAGLDA